MKYVLARQEVYFLSIICNKILGDTPPFLMSINDTSTKHLYLIHQLYQHVFVRYCYSSRNKCIHLIL